MNTAQQAHYDSLYQQHVSALIRQGKSKVTIESYARAVRRIAHFFDRCPDQLSLDELKDYFTQLVKTHSWSTVKIDRNGLQFFYKHVLGKEWIWVNIVKPPQIKTLPDILTPVELSRLINSTREARYQTFILTAYSMGLRLGETLNLRIGDIDAAYPRVHIRRGKGHKDRYVTLPTMTLMALRKYWATHRNPALLFPAGKHSQARREAHMPMDRGGLQKSFKAIAKSCGIHKHVHIHTLRHCYGAHLVEAGLNLRAVQEELGHACPKTTALYTQLTQPMRQNTREMINAMVNQLTISLDGEV
ncbi:MAG: site-specific integrase [Amphritea sp.]